MRIAKIETLPADAGWRTFYFLKLTTDEGLTGWAEYIDNFGISGSLTALLPRYAGIVAGMDPREVGKISTSLHGMTQLATGGLANQAIAAIENACLDVKAKALGVPVHALFGGPTRDRMRLYWSHIGSFRVRHGEFFEKVLGRPRVRSLADLTALGKEAVAQGFTAVKTNPLFFDGPEPRMFDGGFALGPKLLDRNIDGATIAAITDVLGALRDGIGKETGLMIDLNFSQRTEGMRRVAKAVEPYDLTWLEIDTHDPDALALVRRSSSTPIGSLEGIHGLRTYRPFFEKQAVDVAIVDPAWNGVLESYRIATLADAYEVQVAPHNFCGDLATLMSAQLCAAIPNCRIMEYEVDDVPWKHDFVTHPPLIEDGYLVIPTRPGWGADVNEEAVRAHPVKPR
ncbi:MAG TPA: mandelate racemase/muconate lactonizing enzyme family protein [Stellaceae bacterium]|jgi:L-alanine-DL-glutamate epimerase-like enolase superfamily enzyme|nr:mandelate racemase/muconate lactonizing enzyme family protein [Stellaceae bacterium]